MKRILSISILVLCIAGCTKDAALKLPPPNPDPVHYLPLWKTDAGDYYEQAPTNGRKGHWVLCPHGTIFNIGAPPTSTH